MSEQIKTIYLHGSLRRFGKCFRLAVGTPTEAIRALGIQFPGFADAIRSGWFRVSCGAPGRRRDRSDKEIDLGFSHAMHIIPVVAGAGGKWLNIGLIIAGAALFTAAFIPVIAGSPLAAASVFGVSSSTLAVTGLALGLAGLSSLLAAKPKLTNGQSSDSGFQSFLFGAPSDRALMGSPVPVTFGTFRIKCKPISVQFSNSKTANISPIFSGGTTSEIGNFFGRSMSFI